MCPVSVNNSKHCPSKDIKYRLHRQSEKYSIAITTTLLRTVCLLTYRGDEWACVCVGYNDSHTFTNQRGYFIHNNMEGMWENVCLSLDYMSLGMILYARRWSNGAAHSSSHRCHVRSVEAFINSTPSHKVRLISHAYCDPRRVCPSDVTVTDCVSACGNVLIRRQHV